MRPLTALIALALMASPAYASNPSDLPTIDAGQAVATTSALDGGFRLPGTLSGPAYVIDGDTIVVGGVHVRLNGIDAPEVIHPGQPAADPFGDESRDGLRAIINDEIVRCATNGEKTHHREVGVCLLPDGRDIGAELIKQGLALDCAHFSHGRYRALEPDGVREIIRQARYC
jgi:micrococcal nuclease